MYAKGLQRDDSKVQNDGTNFDDWYDARGGFRFDHETDPDQTLTIQGDGYGGQEEQQLTTPLFEPPFSQISKKHSTFNGANLLARWSVAQSERSHSQLQAYFDYVGRDDLLFDQYRRTYDIDFQNRYRFDSVNELLWGVGYRSNQDDIFQRTATILPGSMRYEVFNGFAQDEIAIVQDELMMTLGSKIEHNDFSGVEIEPGVRLMWKPSKNQSVWGAISRAVRTPSRASDGVRLDAGVIPASASGLPTLVQLTGSTTIDSESLISYELGYRAQPIDRISLDLAGYITQNDRLISIEQGQPSIVTDSDSAHTLLPFFFDDQANARTEGIEASATGIVTDRWTLQAAYTLSHLSVGIDPGSTDSVVRMAQSENPKHWASLRSLIKLSDDTEFDSMLRYVDAIPGLEVHSYLDLDLRFGWKVRKGLELSIVGQNLLHDQHLEYVSNVFAEPRAEIQRGVVGKVTWKF
jgi:iron complex outermembrane receptor protein